MTAVTHEPKDGDKDHLPCGVWPSHRTLDELLLSVPNLLEVTVASFPVFGQYYQGNGVSPE